MLLVEAGLDRDTDGRAEFDRDRSREIVALDLDGNEVSRRLFRGLLASPLRCPAGQRRDRNAALLRDLAKRQAEASPSLEKAMDVGARMGLIHPDSVAASGGHDQVGVTRQLQNYELYVGPRYEWALKMWRPFLAGGLSLLRVRGRIEGFDSEDFSDMGFYASTGVDYQVSKHLFLGLGLRRTFEQNGTLYGLGEADVWQYLLRFGVGF